MQTLEYELPSNNSHAEHQGRLERTRIFSNAYYRPIESGVATDLSDYESLQADELLNEAVDRMGLKIQAAIILPRAYNMGENKVETQENDAALSVYCLIDAPSGKRHELNDKTTYYLLSRAQIYELYDLYMAGKESPAMDFLVLNPGDTTVIGRNHWMPGVGSDVELARHDPLYSFISKDQVRVSVDEQTGHLFAEDLYSHNGTRIATSTRKKDSSPQQIPRRTGRHRAAISRGKHREYAHIDFI